MAHRMKPACLLLRTSLLVCSLAFMTAATNAFANDPVAADALYQAGKQLVTEKKYAEACGKFDASYKLDPTLGTLLNLADCYEKAGRIATSWATWGAAMEQAQRDKDPRYDFAKDRRDALSPRLPKVVIRPYGMLPGVDVYWDDTKLAPGAFGTDMPTDVLAHRLVVRRDDGATLLDQKVQVREDGKKTEIPLDIVALNREHPRLGSSGDKSSSAPQSQQRTVGAIVGAVGAVALLTAGGLELGAIAKRDDANAAGGCVNGFCTPTGINSIESARTLAEAGQWIGVSGMVIFSVGATLFFAAPSAPSTSTTPTSPGAQAKIVRAPTDGHSLFVAPSRVWWSPWAGSSGAGFVVGGAL
jgi:hypothetical protein